MVDENQLYVPPGQGRYCRIVWAAGFE